MPNMTEKTAHRFWCPMVRVYDDGSGANRFITVNNNQNIDDAAAQLFSCIGPKCACWTWKNDTVKNVGRCGLIAPIK